MKITKEWFERRAKAEADLEIGAGFSVVNMTDADIAQMEVLAERALPQWAQDELARLREDNAMLRNALAPFAAVAKHDIGSDEVISDFFHPMEKNNHAERLRVGHFRQAFNIFSLGGDVDAL